MCSHERKKKEEKNEDITINLDICINYKTRGKLIGNHFE